MGPGTARNGRLIARVIAALAVLGWIAQRLSARPAEGAGALLEPLVLVVALASFVAPPRSASLGALRRAPGWARPATAYAVVIAVSIATFGPPLAAGRLGNLGDWPVNEAIAREHYDAYAEGRTPSWLSGTSVGDPTSDLYPTTLHTIVARGALLMGSREHVHDLLVLIALLGYVLGALAVTRLALRGSSWPAAVLVGVVVLVDAGSELFTWGTLTTWYWGLLPSTLSISVGLLGLADLFDLEAHPAPGPIARAWSAFALSALLHPIGLILIAAFATSWALRAIFGAARARARRLGVVAHLAVGTLLSSFVWLPSANRIMEHGLHFGTPQVPITLALERMMSGDLPDTAFPLLVTLGYAGGVLALRARRSPAFPLLLAIGALVMLYADPVFLEAGLAPSRTTVRLQSFRIGTIAAPLVYVAAAFALAPGRWIPLLPPGRLRVARHALSLAALVAALALLASSAPAIVAAWRPDAILGRALAPSDTERDDYRALAAYLREQREAMPDDRVARAIYGIESPHPHHLLMLWWDAGVPVASRMECNACFFLREQMYDLSGANLERFAVRWMIAIDRPPPIGDPATERRFGRYFVREIEGWTGALARVTRGAGAVRIERASAAEVVLRLEGERREGPGGEPALVELGIPYYPRWRAVAEDGAELPVYATSGAPGERVERTLALWMRPGRVVLRPSGALPSDRSGLAPTLFAVLAGTVLWPSAWRRRAMRRWQGRRWQGLARAASWIRRAIERGPWRTAAIAGAAIALGVLLSVQGAFGGVARALRIGVFFPRAEVALVGRDGSRTPCAPTELGRRFECRGGVRVFGEMVPLIHDIAMGWAAPSPGIAVETDRRTVVELRIPLRLEGTYYAVCTRGCEATLAVGDLEQRFGADTVRFEVPRGHRSALLRIHTSGRAAAQVLAETAIDVDRTADVPWAPAEPPAAIAR